MKKLEKQLDEYIAYCRDVKHLSPKTISNYEKVMESLERSVSASSVQKITNEMIEQWLCAHSHWSTANLSAHLCAIKAMIRHFQRRGERMSCNPDLIDPIKGEKSKPVFYTKEQIDRVLADCGTLEWLLIRLAFECGFRMTELANLKVSDIDKNRITFIGKGRKNREVYVSDELQEKLEQWIESRRLSDALWTWDDGEKVVTYTVNALRQRMKKAFKKHGFTNFHPHALRHSFATQILRNGAPVHVVKEMLGHSKISTTMIYIHSLQGQLESSFSKYGTY